MTNAQKEWHDRKAAKAAAVLAWGWIFADSLAIELGVTRGSLCKIISHMNAERIVVNTVGRGKSKAYEFDDAVSAEEEKARFDKRLEELT